LKGSNQYLNLAALCVKNGWLDNVFNYFVEAGTGFAEESMQLLRKDGAV